MSYVTQGTVQIELIAGSEAEIEIKMRINPSKDYCVKHRGKTLVIFVDEERKNESFGAIAFDNENMFKTTLSSSHIQHLTNVARKQIHIEIKINSFNVVEGNCIKLAIESVKIPGTLPSGKE